MSHLKHSTWIRCISWKWSVQNIFLHCVTDLERIQWKSQIHHLFWLLVTSMKMTANTKQSNTLKMPLLYTWNTEVLITAQLSRLRFVCLDSFCCKLILTCLFMLVVKSKSRREAGSQMCGNSVQLISLKANSHTVTCRPRYVGKQIDKVLAL